MIKNVTLKGDILTIEVQLSANPQLSDSGKTFGLGSSHGNKPIAATFAGRNMVLGLNLYVPSKGLTQADVDKAAKGMVTATK